jgi:8-oxo-dGTP diphosphatase
MNKEPIKLDTVAAIIECPDGKLLLTKRKGDPFSGFWCLAGGKVEADETLEEACIRETKEETGLDVDIIMKLGLYPEEPHVYKGELYKFSATCFIVKPKDMSKINPQEREVSEIKFFDAFEAKNIQLAFKHNDIIMDYIRYKVNSPLYKRIE